MIPEEDLDKMVTTKDKDNNIKKRLCIITSRSYNDTMEYFRFLMTVALKDFPEAKLELKDFTIKQYGGRFRKRMFGMEFEVECDEMPEAYTETSDHVICSYYPTM